MKPMDSLRFKNLLFGIQDFIIFKDIESKLSKEEINNFNKQYKYISRI